jgi:regulator of RNase E activity RraA
VTVNRQNGGELAGRGATPLAAAGTGVPVASAELITTAHISDVAPTGLVLHRRVRAIWSGARASGPALPVKVAPGDNASLLAAIDGAERGDIIVVDGADFRGRALWGAIMAYAAQMRGVAGLVVDGAVRDVAEITAMQFPVFACAQTPIGPYNKVRGSIGAPISCAGVAVAAGDLVYADDDGVVVIPQADADDILAAARVRAAREEDVVEALTQGLTLREAVPLLRREG